MRKCLVEMWVLLCDVYVVRMPIVFLLFLYSTATSSSSSSSVTLLLLISLLVLILISLVRIWPSRSTIGVYWSKTNNHLHAIWCIKSSFSHCLQRCIYSFLWWHSNLLPLLDCIRLAFIINYCFVIRTNPSWLTCTLPSLRGVHKVLPLYPIHFLLNLHGSGFRCSRYPTTSSNFGITLRLAAANWLLDTSCFCGFCSYGNTLIGRIFILLLRFTIAIFLFRASCFDKIVWKKGGDGENERPTVLVRDNPNNILQVKQYDFRLNQ